MYQNENAIQDFNKVIKTNPDLPEAYYHRARTYLDIDEYEKAIDDLTKAIELNHKYFGAFALRAQAYANLGKMKEFHSDSKKVNSMILKFL